MYRFGGARHSKFWFVGMLFFGLSLTATTWAQAPSATLSTTIHEDVSKSRKFDGQWRVRLRGLRFEDEFNQRSTSEFSLFANLNYRALEEVNFNLAPRFRYATGYVQSQTPSQSNGNQADWLVYNASVDVRPSDYFEISAGALNQEKMHHALLFEDVTFPAVRATLNSSTKNNFILGLRAESAIATGTSLSTQTKEFEKTPTYNAAGVFMKLQRTAVEFDLSALSYQFENLPMSLATSSGLLGNSVDSPNGGTDSEFIYQYKGVLAFGSLKAPLSTILTVGASTAWVKNNAAPEGLNQGTWSRLYSDLYVSKNWMLTPAYEYFRIEPDAAVAGYNSGGVYTNSVGYQAGLSFEYKKTLRTTIAGGEKDALFESPFLTRERIWMLRLETLNVAI